MQNNFLLFYLNCFLLATHLNLKRLYELNCCKTFMSQRNITTRHDMSQTCHMRHIIMPDDQTIENNFAHVTIC